jgi:uncharacterized membrane protein YdjX (TVP38/TMEM64 family)
VEALTGPRVARVRERLERRPLLTIALARLAPGCPATILSYAAGLTRIRLRHFAVGIVIGGAPRVVAYTALGGAARHALWPALAAAALLAVLGVAVTVVARRRRSAAAA